MRAEVELFEATEAVRPLADQRLDTDGAEVVEIAVAADGEARKEADRAQRLVEAARDAAVRERVSIARETVNPFGGRARAKDRLARRRKLPTLMFSVCAYTVLLYI